MIYVTENNFACSWTKKKLFDKKNIVLNMLNAERKNPYIRRNDHMETKWNPKVSLKVSFISDTLRDPSSGYNKP